MTLHLKLQQRPLTAWTDAHLAGTGTATAPFIIANSPATIRVLYTNVAGTAVENASGITDILAEVWASPAMKTDGLLIAPAAVQVTTAEPALSDWNAATGSYYTAEIEMTAEETAAAITAMDADASNLNGWLEVRGTLAGENILLGSGPLTIYRASTGGTPPDGPDVYYTAAEVDAAIAAGGGGGGSGTVTSVSVTTANGVSGTVATATTTPAITLSLGAITPSTVRGLTITTTTGTLTIANGKTLTASNTLTFTGTDGSTLNIGTGGTLGTAAFTASSAYAAASHAHAGTDITSGTISAARLGSGSGGTSKFLREDSTWQTIAGGGDLLAANNLSDVANTGLALVTLTGEIAANLVFAGPSTGGADNPSFRALATADMPAGTATESWVTGTFTGSTNLATLGTVVTGTWQSTAVAVAYGGTGAGDASTARTNLGTDDAANLTTGTVALARLVNTQTVGNADATISTGTRDVLLTAALTAPRVYTLPAASGYPAGARLTFADIAQTLTATNTATLQRAGSDTINGGTSIVLSTAGASPLLISDGTSKWNLDIRGVSRGGTGATSASGARTNLGLAIGTNVQAWDADLDALAALSGTNTIYYRSASNTWSAVTIGSGLSFSSGTLSASGGSSPTISSFQQNVFLWEEYLGEGSFPATPVGAFGLVRAVSGSGAVITGSSLDVTTAPGVALLSTGTTTTGYATHNSSATATRLGGGTYKLEARVYMPALVDGTDSGTVRFGFIDSTTGTDGVDGVFFRFSNANANWIMVARSNSSETATASTTAPSAATWYKLRIEINAAASSAEFFVDGVSIGTVSTNIPTGSARYCGPGISITKSAGTTARTLLVDYIGLEIGLTSSR